MVVRATDNYGVTQVSISIDGEQVAYGNSVPFRATIDTIGLTPGSHVLRLEVSDPHGYAQGGHGGDADFPPLRAAKA